MPQRIVEASKSTSQQGLCSAQANSNLDWPYQCQGPKTAGSTTTARRPYDRLTTEQASQSAPSTGLELCE